jgi:dihydrofolate synthase/folylpolyglutamate synthase
VLIDGAHNPSGATALRDYLNEFVNNPITLVFGVMRDKRVEEMANIVFPASTNLILTQPDNPRAANLDMLRHIAVNHLPPEQIFLMNSSSEAMRFAREITPPSGLICVAGSLYLAGEVIREIVGVKQTIEPR